MQKQLEGNKLAQWGLLLVVIGVAIRLAIWLAPFTYWAIAIGVILLVIGLVKPGRRRY